MKGRCEFCGDLRAVRAVAKENSLETLMLCSCTIKRPDVADWKLPAIGEKWRGRYFAYRCPLDWFKPMRAVGPNDLPTTIHNRASLWIAKVRIAEQFWQQYEKENHGQIEMDIVESP